MKAVFELPKVNWFFMGDITITRVFFAALTLGCVLVLIALIFLRKGSTGDSFKAVSDMFMKLAVVIFGVSIGLLGFFGQKWIEDTNEKIQQANEALGNVDIIQSEYMSDVENVYFNNDPEFIKLYKSCAEEIALSDLNASYCEKNNIQSKPMPTDTLLNGIDYFDYAEPDEILKEFPKMIYDQTFIKRTNNTNIVRDLFDNYNEVLKSFF